MAHKAEENPCMRILCVVVVFVVAVSLTAAGQQSRNGTALETVTGKGCYTYGDDDTPRKARAGALALAEEEAVRSYRVYVESSTTVKNLRIEDDLIQSASAGMLRNVKTQEEANGRTI